ncbi:MAG TPA: hydrogenase expression/formation protein HypE [Bacteroidota bacterium]|nr:hydrogenase expression/formation protein HypE [Bacteroidota bacterium]
MKRSPDAPANAPVDFTCPVPLSNYERILLAHGSGGTLTHRLIREVFAAAFRNDYLELQHDGAILPLDKGLWAFSTDSYVVRPIIFPGGTIGDLAVNGTVNDLAMCGAKPRYLSASFILEEGLEISELCAVVESMRRAALASGITIVTGDTKVVDRGKGDKMFITTSGIGIIPEGIVIDPRSAKPGDQILVSGTIADHGIAVMSVREGLEFETAIRSDTAPLNSLAEQILNVSSNIHVLRDPTRGGLATTLNEIAQQSNIGLFVRESSIPVDPAVASACEILGFDPLFVANEGKMVAFVGAEDADRVLAAMRNHPLGQHAAVIGEVTAEHPAEVVMESSIGGKRILGMLSGEQLPRIC